MKDEPLSLTHRTEARDAMFPCFPAQLRFWFEEQLAPNNPALLVTARWQIDGSVSPARVELAWKRLLLRHAALRTSIRSGPEEPMQCVESTPTLSLCTLDLRGMSRSSQDAEITRVARIQASLPFDLCKAPLIRVKFLQLSGSRSVLLVAAHQIACDRWSLDLLRREFGQLIGDSEAAVPAVETSAGTVLGAVAIDQRQRTRPEMLAAERDAARDLLRGARQFELPTDRPRPRRLTSNGASAVVIIESTEGAQFLEFSSEHGVSPGLVALAALFVLFSRYSGETDILLCSPVSGRDDVEIPSLVGSFANTIAVRGNVEGDPDFATVLERTCETVSCSLKARQLPIQQLIEIADPARDPSRNALFSISVDYDLVQSMPERYRNITISDQPSLDVGALYDLSFRLCTKFDGLEISCQYNTDLFDAGSIRRLLDCYRTLLNAAITQPGLSVSRLAILSAQQYSEIGQRSTSSAYPNRSTLPQLIRDQARQTPNSVAALCPRSSLTYAALEHASNILASRIRRSNVAPRAHVGIMLTRSTNLIVAMLGILKAGCAYVPLDPMYPLERLRFIASDSCLAAIVSESSLSKDALIAGCPVILIDDAGAREESDAELEDVGISPEDVAYVIYTSGSTGKPKGVQISHRALINFLWSMRERPGMTAADTLVAVTTISFDIAGLELFLPLVCGANVVIASEHQVVDGRALLALLRESRATIMQATPVTWQLLIDAGWNGNPRLAMLCGGEALSRTLAEELLSRGSILWNMYGPTETTIWSAVGKVIHEDGPVLIGPPINNTQFFVLDRTGELVPHGVPGELFIAGDGVAVGYFGRDDLTQERFLPDRFSEPSGGRMYRTGDIVRQRAGGYEFLGRVDEQIKLRGFRIELDEIVSALLRQDGVADATAIVTGANSEEKCIRAFVVASPGIMVPKDELVRHLKSQISAFLPAYMLPAMITVCVSLPRTPNGKIDRIALSQVGPDPTARLDAMPWTATEVQLARLVARLLGRDTIDRTEDLFEIGLHSLLVVRLIKEIRDVFASEIAVRVIFDERRIDRIAEHIDALREGQQFVAPEPAEPIVIYNREGLKPPFIYFHSDLETEGMYCRKLATVVGPSQPIFAAAPHGLAGLPIRSSIEEMAREYLPLVRKLAPNGPYRLGGHCDGGFVAFELARMLQQEGETVEQVVISNAYAPATRSPYVLDMLIRWVGLNEALKTRPRERICTNINRFVLCLSNGLGAVIRFLAERIRTIGKLDERDYQNSIEHPDIPVRVPGTHETRQHFAQLVACFTYHPKYFDGDLTLIWSSGEPLLMGDPTLDDATKGWGALARRVSVLPINGDHNAPIRERVEEFGSLIVAAFTKNVSLHEDRDMVLNR